MTPANALEQPALRAALAARGGFARGGQADVLESRGGRDAAARRARDEPDLQEERLHDLFERAALLGQRRRHGLDADRAAVEALADHREVPAIERVEAGVIDREAIERMRGHRAVDRAVAFDRGEVAHAAQQAVRDAGRAARAAPDLLRAVLVHRHPDDVGPTL